MSKTYKLATVFIFVVVYWTIVGYMTLVRDAFHHGYYQLVLLLLSQHVLVAYAAESHMWLGPGSGYLDEPTPIARGFRLFLAILVFMFSVWFLVYRFYWE